MSKTDELQQIFLHPLELKVEHWDTIRKIARIMMDEFNCDYTKAVILAYIEWFELAEMDATRH